MGDVIRLEQPPTTGVDDLDDLLAKEFGEGLSRHGVQHLWTCPLALDQIARGVDPTLARARGNAEIELAVELVRRDVSRGRPSRYQCAFACDSAKALRTYAKATGFGDEFQVAVLDAEPDPERRFDAAWLKSGSPLNDWRHAQGYWSGEPLDPDAPQWEYLVELPVKVLEVRPR